MMRKLAFIKAFNYLTDNEAKLKITEILEDMPFIGWTENTIFDTFD